MTLLPKVMMELKIKRNYLQMIIVKVLNAKNIKGKVEIYGYNVVKGHHSC